MLTKNEALSLVSLSGIKLRDIDDTFKNDKDIVLAAITQEGWSFRYASDNLKNDKDTVLSAIKKSQNLRFQASSELVDDDAVVFVYNYGYLISELDWPIIKRALLEKPEYFFNPEPYIKALTDGMENPYLTLAQYALNKDMVIEPTDYPELML